MSAPRSLPTDPIFQPAAEAERIAFSATSTFRFVYEGAVGLPDFCEERASRGDGAPMHRHPWASWELVLEGRVRMVVADRVFLMGPGDSIYVPPDVPHGYVVESDEARAVGINLSDGRFPSLQRKAAPLMNAPGGPDMQKIVALAKEHGVDVLGPPPSVEER